MKNRCLLIFFAALFILTPILSYGQEAATTDKKTKQDCKVSYVFISEFGCYIGDGFAFTNVFVNGIRFNKKKDILGIGLGYETEFVSFQYIPIYLNYRHYFRVKKSINPFLNVGIGTRISFGNGYYPYRYNSSCKAGFYSVVSAGVKVKAFTLSSGFFVKSFGFSNFAHLNGFFGGMEVKAGFTF